MIRRLNLAVGLISAALLAFQIILLQAFSIVQWYHFAYMVISVALLGFGASGTVLTLARNWFTTHYEPVLVGAMAVSGLSMPVALALTQSPAAHFESYLLLAEAGQGASLIITYLLLAVPFFFGALAIGLTFMVHTERIGALYFSNLIGSGAGGSIGLLLLYISTPSPLAGVTGLMAIAAAGILAPKRRSSWSASVLAAAAVVDLLLILFPAALNASEYKDLERALLMPGVEVVSTRPHPLGVVQIVRGDVLRPAPGLSLAYRGEVPAHDLLFVNGDMIGAVGGPDLGRIRDFTTSALPFVVDTPERVLVLGGIRTDAIGQALRREAGRVVVIEPHGGVYTELTRTDSGVSASLLLDSRVETQVEQTRSFLARNPELFDLIVLPELGSFSGSSGLLALQEQYDLTVEAIGDLWNHLSETGSISVTVWMDYPPRHPIRILATIVETMEQSGVAPITDHLMAVRGWGAITFVARKRAISAEHVRNVRSWSRDLSFDPLILPGLNSAERQIHNRLQDNTFFHNVDSLIAGNRSSFYDRYAFRVSPATDDRPYFSQFLKWDRIEELTDHFGRDGIPFFELGTLIVGLALSQIVVIAIILILAPLARRGWSRTGRWWTFVYFGGLAVGYMFFEMVMIQRYTLYFGHPVRAIAFVFTVLLISSGLGSIYSARLLPRIRNLRYAAGCVAAGLVVLLVVLTSIMELTTGFSISFKLVTGVALLAPVSFLMGIPFPLGLRALHHTSRWQVPWAWGINGCLSVASAPAAILLAAEAGATIVLLAATCAYAIVSLTSLELKEFFN